MDQLEWCKKQKSGIRIIEPNSNIAENYFLKADNSLKMAVTVPSDEWKVIGSYYACYDSIYALLQKAGIKCEIHDCSILLMKFFGFTKKEVDFMKKLKENRTNAQYYVNRKYYIENINKIKDFVLRCKEVFHKADFEKIHKDIVKELR